MCIHIHIHADNHLLNKKIDKLMATVQEITDAIAKLQADLDAKQAALATLIQSLKDQIAAGGATPAQLQTILDSINTVDTDVNSTPVE